LYGANAMGGVVNIETALSGEESSGFLLGGGSFTSGQMNVFLKREKWGLAAGGGSSAGYLPNSATRKSHLSGEYSFGPAGENNGRLVLQGYLLTKDAEIPASPFSSPGSQSDQRYILNLSGKSQTAKNLWEYRVFTQSWDNRYKDDFSDDRHRVEGRGAELSVRQEEGRHILLAGLSLAHDSFDSTKSGQNSRSYGGVFFQDLWALRRDLALLSGLRWDTSSDYGAALSPRVSLIKHLTGNLSIKAGYGRAFRPPTVNELYWYDPQWSMFGNPDLRPEKGESYDLTLHWQDRAGDALSAGIFRSRLTDGITWVQEAEGWKTKNIDRVKITGFDLRWERRAENGFGGDLTYTWLNREDWNPDTGYVKNTRLGEHRIAIGVTFTRGPWQARACWQLVAGRTPQLGQAMPDYHLLDTAIIYRTRNGYDLKLAVNNLLDTAYEINAGYPMSGRNLEVSIYHVF
jgi:vitamin B12 transporter